MTALLPLWAAALGGMLLVMTGAWAVWRTTGQGGWIDACWTLGVGLCASTVAVWPVSADESDARQVLVAALIAIWSIRLGWHLVRRAAGGPPDGRYKALEQDWGAAAPVRMYVFLVLQALAGAGLVLTPLLAAHRPGPGLATQDLIAAAVLILAVIGEGVADRQLAAFKADPANRERVCDVGLWAWSRHPNYFFEWLGWCAWPLFAIDLSGVWPWGWLALSGPGFILWLLTRVSGVPPLEAHMRRTRPKAFAAYAARTSVFFPMPPKRAAD